MKNKETLQYILSKVLLKSSISLSSSSLVLEVFVIKIVECLGGNKQTTNRKGKKQQRKKGILVRK